MSIYDVLTVLRERGPMTESEVQEAIARGHRLYRPNVDIRKLARKGLIVPRGARSGTYGHAAVVWGLA